MSRLGDHSSSHDPIPLQMEGFQWIKCLGRGGFAETHLYADLHQRYGRHVAVKIPHNKELEEALIRGDILSLASLQNIPHIVRILDIHAIEGRYVLLMEYVEGPSLRELIGPTGRGRPLPANKAIAYTQHIAKGLQASHDRQMVHRDIKPANIIISREDDTAQILDFGIASIVNDQGSFETQSKRHTPIYSPPELIFEGKGDHRVDIYSLGVTLYEMLTGGLPYFNPSAPLIQAIMKMRENGPPSVCEQNPDIPRFLEKVVQTAMAPNPEDRPRNMEELIRSLAPPPELKLAHEHMAAGATRRAEHVLKALIERAPQDARGFVALASIYNRCQKTAEAEAVLSQALCIEPRDADLHFRRGATLLKLGRSAAARESLEEAGKWCRNERLRRKIATLTKATGVPDKEPNPS